MKNSIKTIAIALILALSFGTAVQAAPSGPLKKVGKASVSRTTSATTTATVEHIQAGTHFTMPLNPWMRGDVDIEIYDLDGNLIQAAETQIEGQDNTLKFKVGELENGLYKIKVLTRSRTQSKRIMID